MKVRPILFSGAMVRALLDGTKTQTRRVVKPQPERRNIEQIGNMLGFKKRQGDGFWLWPNARERILAECPYGQPGDRLWVRETWQVARETLDYETGGEYDVFEWPDELGDPRLHLNGDARFGMKAGLFYAADGEHKNPSVFYNLTGIDNKTILRPREITWRPSIHMPRWASRITLEITSVRVERLQNISRGDAMGEGCPFQNMAQGDDPRQWYAQLWDRLNGTGSWDANPWVWVIEFRPIEAQGGAAC